MTNLQTLNELLEFLMETSSIYTPKRYYKKFNPRKNFPHNFGNYVLYLPSLETQEEIKFLVNNVFNKKEFNGYEDNINAKFNFNDMKIQYRILKFGFTKNEDRIPWVKFEYAVRITI